MRKIGKLAAILVCGDLLFVYVIHGGLGVADFRSAFMGVRSDHSLNNIPPTLRGSLHVSPAGRPTKDLYLGLVKLAKEYGFESVGDDGGINGRWGLQVNCRENAVAGVITAEGAQLVMFHTFPYAFKDRNDYDSFNSKMLKLFSLYGVVDEIQREAPLTQEELLARGKYMQIDVTSQCVSQPSPSQ